MDFGDFLLTPIYILILYFIFKARRKKYDDAVLKKYHRQAFWVKIFSCLVFILYNLYLSPGDSTHLYHHEGTNLYHLILNNPENVKYLFQSGKHFDLSLVDNPYNRGYFSAEANFMMIRLDAILSFITFGSYAAISLIFAAIAFSGLWKLYLFFYSQYPEFHKKFAIAILFFPSVVFWSSGLLKDTLCIAAIGWITYSVYELLYHKRKFIKNIVILFIFSYLLIILKVYILLSYLPFFILFIIFKNLSKVKNNFLKFILTPILISICILGFIQIFSSYGEELGAYSIDEVTSSISSLNAALTQKTGEDDAASNFNLGATYDGTFSGLIAIAPYAITATFFRPFIWETGKISQLMAALESLVLMCFTLFIILKARLRILKWVIADPLIMYCFFFSLVFGLFIGASTLNFGTLVRYKIPCLPFYTISLFLIYEKVKERKAAKSMEKLEEGIKNNIPVSAVIP